MQSLAQLAPLLILFPALGAIINFFWGMRLGERFSAIIGSTSAALTFVVAVCLLGYLVNNDYMPLVINLPLLGKWIEIKSAGVEIGWQMRVDTLSVAMMMFVTFVGTLIHIYAAGYMHGDARFPRFFAYLNMFLAFMLILVSGNNFLMMFVGWEGVGLCSYLLIGFWWDKPHGEGIKNSNAARKAFIANRIGDFGVLMAMFLIFWTFGTLDFFKAGEIANPDAGQHHGEEATAEHEEEAAAVSVEGETPAAETAAEAVEGAEATTGEGAEAAEAEGEEGGEEVSHEVEVAAYSYKDSDIALSQLGVFGQAARIYAEHGEDHDVEFGPFSLSFDAVIVLITLFLLLGATGKSAQIPLFVWLPDAMAGPTPVSALIHAATMVTAGVYMMVRSNVFFSHAEFTSIIVTLIGAGTAMVGGFIALGQFDIKRVLAYSTISQLGFMVAAVGVGAYPAAMFHMITHAFFKALLFLGSGSVIHGVEHGHHEAAHHGHGHHDDDGHHADDFDPQDMRNMGGLSKKMPITYWTYLLGTLALAGIFPFAGFWSKDEILAESWLLGLDANKVHGFLAVGILLGAAGFTAFYMWRQIEMVFHGEARTEAAAHAHESSWVMTIPLMILGFFSIFIGFINVPSNIFILSDLFGTHRLTLFLEHSITAVGEAPAFQVGIALGALALGIGAIFVARSIYGGVKAVTPNRRDPLQINPSTGEIWRLSNHRMYWDEIYFRLFINPFNRIAQFLANTLDWAFWHDYVHDRVLLRGFNTIAALLSNPFDLGIIDGAVNGVGWVMRNTSGRLRRVQTGYVRTYAVALLLGVVAVVVIMLWPMIRS